MHFLSSSFVVLGSILILWKIRLPAAGSIAVLAGSTLLGAGIVGFLRMRGLVC